MSGDILSVVAWVPLLAGGAPAVIVRIAHWWGGRRWCPASDQPAVAAAYRYARVAASRTAPRAKRRATARGDADWRVRGPERQNVAWCGVSRRT